MQHCDERHCFKWRAGLDQVPFCIVGMFGHVCSCVLVFHWTSLPLLRLMCNVFHDLCHSLDVSLMLDEMCSQVSRPARGTPEPPPRT